MADLETNESALPPEISRLLLSGFVEVQGCVLLASQAHNFIDILLSDTQDETGYECFINHLHIQSLQFALAFAHQLTSSLTERFEDSFAVILGFDGQEANVRFHKIRSGQSWLAENLEGYEEGIAVLNTH